MYEKVAITLFILAFLLALLGNLTFFAIEHHVRSVGYPTRLMKSLPYTLRILRNYRESAETAKWPGWLPSLFWICVAGMFVAAFTGSVLLGN